MKTNFHYFLDRSGREGKRAGEESSELGYDNVLRRGTGSEVGEGQVARPLTGFAAEKSCPFVQHLKSAACLLIRTPPLLWGPGAATPTPQTGERRCRETWQSPRAGTEGSGRPGGERWQKPVRAATLSFGETQIRPRARQRLWGVPSTRGAQDGGHGASQTDVYSSADNSKRAVPKLIALISKVIPKTLSPKRNPPRNVRCQW